MQRNAVLVGGTGLPAGSDREASDRPGEGLPGFRSLDPDGQDVDRKNQ